MKNNFLIPYLKIGASVDCSCKITIKDLSDYGSSGMAIPREGFAIALFYTKDDWTTVYSDMSNPGSTGNPGTWIITTPSGGQWLFEAYWVEIWDVANNYGGDDITFYNGNYYYTIVGVAAGQAAPNINSNWIIMPSLALTAYGIFQTCVANTQDDFVYWSFVNVDQFCGYLTSEHLECYKYKLCNTTEDLLYFSVTNLTGDISTITTDATQVLNGLNEIVAWSIPAGECVQVTLPSEGVYILNYGITTADQLPYQEVIFELCKYYDCYFELIKQILCADFDPCCNDCDKEKKRKNEIFRLTLNKMGALINTLQIKTFYDNVHYGNLFNITPNRALELFEIQDILNMLNNIIVRCGLCNGAQTKSKVEPCKGC